MLNATIKIMWYILELGTAFVVVSHCETGYVCEVGYSGPTNSQSCYRLVNSPVSNYAQAHQYCQKEGGNLTSIHNAFEDAYIRSFGNDGMLIGLRYFDNNDTYQWSDGTTLDYKNYGVNFVADRDYLGYCAQYRNAKWENANCETDYLKFICKKPAKNYTLTPTDACPDSSVYHTDSGVILSPGYPLQYTWFLNCAYNIKVEKGYVIKMFLDDLDIAYASDYFEIVNQDAEDGYILQLFRTETAGWEITLRLQKIRINFYARSSGTWKFSWLKIKEPSIKSISPVLPISVPVAKETVASATPVDACPTSGTVYKESGVLYSPGYPQKYEQLPICLYELLAKNEYFIKLRMDEADFPASDYFNLYQLSSGQWQRAALSSLLNGSQETEMIIPHNRILLEFHSRGTGQWKLSWSEKKIN